MSAIATFQLPNGVEPPMSALHRVWADGWVSAIIESDGRTLVSLGYWFGSPQQSESLQSAAKLLLSHLRGHRLYYFRDEVGLDPGTQDFSRPITVAELVSAEFAPGARNGIHFRYEIRDHAA
jgi:hypothetical protein